MDGQDDFVRRLLAHVEAGTSGSRPCWLRIDVLRNGTWHEGPVMPEAALGSALEMSAFVADGVEAMRGVWIGAADAPEEVLAFDWDAERGWRDVWRRDFEAGMPYHKPVAVQVSPPKPSHQLGKQSQSGEPS